MPFLAYTQHHLPMNSNISNKQLGDIGIIGTQAARWIVLAIVSFVMMTGYVVAKEMSPLQYFLQLPVSQGGLGWSGSEFGLFAGSRGFFNVFFLMLFVSGIVLDKMGVRFSGALSCILMLAGTLIDYVAITQVSPAPTVSFSIPLFGIDYDAVKIQVLAAAMGFAVFGIGYELCGIVVSKIIVKWFSGKEMALAMGIQVAMARLGTALALGCGPILATKYQLSTPIMVGLVSVALGLLCYFFYCGMDRSLDAAQKVKRQDNADDDGFHFSDLRTTLKSGGFWLITILCLLYYSALYPFLDFATSLMITKYGFDAHLAGLIPAILPFTSIVLTPLFGTIYDHIGRGATIMILGTALLTVVLVVFALPFDAQWIAIALMLVLGIAFSLLPSVLWPAVPKIVPLKQLGTAYSIIYYIQNIGLMIVPIVIGGIIEHDTIGGTTDYSGAMWCFAAIGCAAVLVSVCLFIKDKKADYGLENANMTSKK